MKVMRIVLMVCFVLFSFTAHAQLGVDNSALNITSLELSASIKSTPSDSTTHESILHRAYISRQSRVAYEEYTSLWLKFPNNAYTNLWRATAVMTLLMQQVVAQQAENLILLPTPLDRSDVLAQSPSIPHGAQSNIAKRLDPVALARSCFAHAIKLNPNSALINLEEGFFLWQWNDKMEDGLKMMRHALEMSPNEPIIHLRLSEVYANHSGNAYDLDKSLGELRTVLRLAPSLSATHADLVDVWLQKKNYKKAQSELQIYLHMVPEQRKQSKWVQWMQQAIDAGLNSNAR